MIGKIPTSRKTLPLSPLHGYQSRDYFQIPRNQGAEAVENNSEIEMTLCYSISFSPVLWDFWVSHDLVHQASSKKASYLWSLSSSCKHKMLLGSSDKSKKCFASVFASLGDLDALCRVRMVQSFTKRQQESAVEDEQRSFEYGYPYRNANWGESSYCSSNRAIV